MNLEDLAIAVGSVNIAASDDQPIALVCLHFKLPSPSFVLSD